MPAKLFRPHQHVSNSISIIILILLLSLFVSQHNAKNDTKMYNTCKKTTTSACDKHIREGIRFPFWVDGIRDKDCGLAGYELSCEENDLVLDIGSNIKYHVVEINLSTKMLQLNPGDSYVEHICKPDSGSIPETRSIGELYDYGQQTEDLHLFYRCHETKAPTYYNFNCSNEYKDPVYFFLENPLPQARNDLSSCSYATLPFSKSLLEEFIMNRIAPYELLRSSFDVYYNTSTDQKACAECSSAGGLCWLGTYPNSTDKCLFPQSGVPNLITL